MISLRERRNYIIIKIDFLLKKEKNTAIQDQTEVAQQNSTNKN
jgi:hypothetical protein